MLHRSLAVADLLVLLPERSDVLVAVLKKDFLDLARCRGIENRKSLFHGAARLLEEYLSDLLLHEKDYF